MSVTPMAGKDGFHHILQLELTDYDETQHLSTFEFGQAYGPPNMAICISNHRHCCGDAIRLPGRSLRKERATYRIGYF